MDERGEYVQIAGEFHKPVLDHLAKWVVFELLSQCSRFGVLLILSRRITKLPAQSAEFVGTREIAQGCDESRIIRRFFEKIKMLLKIAAGSFGNGISREMNVIQRPGGQHFVRPSKN